MVQDEKAHPPLPSGHVLNGSLAQEALHGLLLTPSALHSLLSTLPTCSQLSNHIELLAVCQAQRAISHLSAFAHVISSAWNALKWKKEILFSSSSPFLLLHQDSG